MKFFGDFADTGVGSWFINGLSVMAFFVVAHLLVSRLTDSGLLGALKAVVLSA